MQNGSRAQNDISRAEQFLIDDAKHLARFQAMRESQEKNLADFEVIMARGPKLHDPFYDAISAEQAVVAKEYKTVMAENDRLVAEEKAILNESVVTKIARLIRLPSAAETAALAKIRQNAIARQAKNRITNQ